MDIPVLWPGTSERGPEMAQNASHPGSEGMLIRSPCPVCSEGSMVMSNTPLTIPYFGEALQITIVCGSCNYRHTDMQLFGSKEPVRFTLRLTDGRHLSARVVRSASGTIKIPELGMDMEPGVASDAFVTNAEGILDRFRGALETARGGLEASLDDHDDVRDKLHRAEELLATLDSMKAGKTPHTLIIEDPYGNSAILSPDAVREVLTPEEINGLKTGYFEIDISEIEDAAPKKGTSDGDV